MEERFVPSGASFFEARLVKDGPPIGLMTFFGPPYIDGELLDRSCRWQCLVRTETTARMILMGDELPIEVDGVHLRNVSKIDKGSYLHLVDHAAWSTAHAPHLPDAAPKVKIDKRGANVF